MPVVTKRPRAFADLIEIWEYIADDSPASATRFLGLVEDTLDGLARQPSMGRARDELADHLRSFPIGRYVVYYLPLDDGIDLVRMLHGSRDISDLDFRPGLTRR